MSGRVLPCATAFSAARVLLTEFLHGATLVTAWEMLSLINPLYFGLKESLDLDLLEIQLERQETARVERGEPARHIFLVDDGIGANHAEEAFDVQLGREVSELVMS